MKAATPSDLPPSRTRLHIVLVTTIVALAYAAAMIFTNTRFTLLDDESLIIAAAEHPVLPTIKLFLTGRGQHEHPPFSDILLHEWLLLTNSNLFALRIFANLFYIGSSLALALAAGKLSGTRAYWTTLLLTFLWPFAFQYGRITGWYCVAMFLLACTTLAYIGILADRNRWAWFAFAILSVLLVWTNYFGVILLLLLCADLLLFHPALARKHRTAVASTIVIIAASFLSLIRAALSPLENANLLKSNASTLKTELLSAGYSVYCVFASAAIAPWYWPFSIPVAIGSITLLIAVWYSKGRRWLGYFGITLLLLAATQHLTIKRIIFLLPWFFLAIGIATAERKSKHALVATCSSALLIACGLAAIASGRHYATTNLREPWEQISRVVARDARSGATLISDNVPFFLYSDYQLGLVSDLHVSDGPDLGVDVYRRHGYSILDTDLQVSQSNALHGKVVMVLGSSTFDDVAAIELLNDSLATRCRKTGEFRGAPDPAFSWKKQFTRDVPTLAYRSRVIWYDCP